MWDEGSFSTNSFSADSFYFGTTVGGEEHFSGGWEYGRHGGKRRTRKELEEERRKFGIIEQIIETVAERQVEDLHLDTQQRLEELTREFKLREIEYESRYWEILNIKREKLINEEIKSLLKKKQNEDELVLMMMIAMSL